MMGPFLMMVFDRSSVYIILTLATWDAFYRFPQGASAKRRLPGTIIPEENLTWPKF